MSIFKKREKVDYKDLYYKELVSNHQNVSRLIYLTDRLAAALEAMRKMGAYVDPYICQQIYLEYCVKRDKAEREMEKRNNAQRNNE